MKHNQNTREPAVAGTFYPTDKEELSREIDDFLDHVRIDDINNARTPKIIFVPHAGYEYSGQTAAYGYKLLEGSNIKKVILLGSSHHYPVYGLVADGSDHWETPLGKVELDKDLISKTKIPIDSAPFAPEHSLEVQLPFLQKILPAGFRIVPIIAGNESQERFREFAKTLGALIDDQTIVVISSDLSHYPSHEDAKQYDRETIGSILTGDPKKFEDKIDDLEQRNIPGALTFMCARLAVGLGIMLAEIINAKDIKLIKYANSGDITGDKSRVVGYAAIGFFGRGKNGQKKFDNIFIGKKEQKDLLKMARDSVELFVENGRMPKFSRFTKFNQQSGIFVTLTADGNLRGCIGLIESDQPLYKTVPQMAVAAAVDDPRFNPVTEEELSELEYEISVLSPMKKINDISEIKLGIHGVKIQRGYNSGVFLPQVAEETGWGKEEFLSNLCENKAGLPANCWQDPATEIYVFTAQVFGEG